MAANIKAAEEAAAEVFAAAGLTRAQVNATMQDIIGLAERSEKRDISADMFVPLVGYGMGAFIGAQQCALADKVRGFCILWKLLNYGAAEMGVDMDEMQRLMQQDIDKHNDSEPTPQPASSPQAAAPGGDPTLPPGKPFNDGE
jgi:hypothetical protein